MAFDVKNLAQAIRSENTSVKTGQVVSYDVYSAVVNVDGQDISMKLMDHVTVSLNRVVVCLLNGDTGFVIGTLDNTARTPVASDGTASNSSTTVSTVQYGTYTYAPKAISNYYSSGAWSYNVNEVQQGTTPYGTAKGFWFYGSKRFIGLKGKTITKVQIYLKFKTGSSATLGFHGYAGAPNSAPTTGGSASVKGGWVTLPTSFGTYLAAAGTGGIAAIGSSVATMKGLPDGGTLKISWKK